MQARLRVLVAFVALLSLVGCGRDEATLGATPGFNGAPKPEDSTPFTLAGPTPSGGPTTLPEGFFGRKTPTTSGSAGSAPTVVTVTPTTALGELVMPDLSGVESLCGFEATVGPFIDLPSQTPAQTRTLMTGLVDVTARYAEVAPPEARADIRAIREIFIGLDKTLADNGWNPRSDAYLGKVAEFSARARIPGSLGARLQHVVEVERRTCP